MDLSEPWAAVCPTLDGPVLAALASTSRPLAAREVARLVRRGSWGGVRKVLVRLAEHGIVQVEEAGNVTLYSLNREHLAAPAVEQLMAMRDELVRRLAQAIASWSVPPVHASLFGSAARGDGDVTSDIDLFVVRPRAIDQDDATWRSQFDRLATEVLVWTGNHAGISEVGERDVGLVRKTDAGKSIREEGITLAGEHLDTILGNQA